MNTNTLSYIGIEAAICMQMKCIPTCLSLFFLCGAHAVCNKDTHVSRKEMTSALAGSTKSFKSLLAQLPCLDGGELEEAYIGIGEALFKSPDKLAPYTIESPELSAHDVSSISTMLPTRFVDAPCKQVTELQRRARIVQHVQIFGSTLRPISLRSIEISIADIQKWCSLKKSQ